MMRAFSPTARQNATLRFIYGYQLAHGGVSPTLLEIARGIGVKGKSAAHELLRHLEERGQIRRLPNRVRAIEILQPIAIPRGPEGEPLFFVPVPHMEGTPDG